MPKTKIPAGVGPRFPQVVVLFGATGDLARRKLLPVFQILALMAMEPPTALEPVPISEEKTRRRCRCRSTASGPARACGSTS